MIYVTLGTQKFQFDRLLRKLDNLIDNGIIKADELIVQCKFSNYIPLNYTHYDLLSPNQVSDCLNNADLVITHAGTGSIVQCIKKNKRTIIFPRLLEFGEHVDNHQVEMAEVFKNKGNATVLYEVDDLDNYLRNIDDVHLINFEMDNSQLLVSIDHYLHNLIKEKR